MQISSSTKAGYPRIYVGGAVDSLLRYLSIHHKDILASIHTIGFVTDSSEDAVPDASNGTDSGTEEVAVMSSPVKELRDIIEYYNNIDWDLNRPIVINLSMIVDPQVSFKVQSMLLKFLEETSHRVIILSSSDDLMSTILSRVSLVCKIPVVSDYSFGKAWEARTDMAVDFNGIKLPLPIYKTESLKRSVEMARVDTMCRVHHHGRGFKERIAKILEKV